VAALLRVLLTAGHPTHGLVDVDAFLLDLFQLQPAPWGAAITDPHNRDPAFFQGRSIFLRALPVLLGPFRIVYDGETDELGSEVRDAFVQSRPVLSYLFAPGEGSRGVYWLLAPVVFIEAGEVCLEVIARRSRSLTASFSCSSPLICWLLSAPGPIRSRVRCPRPRWSRLRRHCTAGAPDPAIGGSMGKSVWKAGPAMPRFGGSRPVLFVRLSASLKAFPQVKAQRGRTGPNTLPAISHAPGLMWNC